MIVLVVFGYLVVSGKQNSNQDQPTATISNAIRNDKYGYSFTPPEGWKLWEGSSAAMDASFSDDFADYETMTFKPGSADFKKLQNYIANWKPNESNILFFTSSPDIDVKTRDGEYIGVMGTTLNEEPLIFQTLSVSVVDIPINYVEPKILADREFTQLEVENVPGKIQVMRGFLPERDLIWIQVPLGSGKHIWLERFVRKDEDSKVEDFVRGISFVQ